MLRDVKSPQRLERRITVVIDETAGTPVVTVGSQHVTVTDNGVGDYTLTLVNPASRTLVAIATPLTDNRAVAVTARTISTVRLVCKDLSNAAAESDLAVEIIAWDSPDET